MKIFIGSLIPENTTDILSSSYVIGNHLNKKDIKIFNFLDNDKYSNISKLLTELTNFNPDLIILWRPEFEALPIELLKFNKPKIGIITDWSIETERILNLLPLLDWTFTDYKGYKFFKERGFNNISPWTVAGYIPELHKNLNLEKKYDITFIGGLNHNIHKHRLDYLYRLYKLSNKYKIKIAGGIYGNEYVKILNQSKIVFNNSIRSELNMRFYETLACGSFQILEEDNIEAKYYFELNKDYIGYNIENFESIINYYLNNETEREKISINGHIKVKQHTYENHFSNLLNKIFYLKENGYLEKKTFHQINKQNNINIYLKQLISPNSHILYLQKNTKEYFSNLEKQFINFKSEYYEIEDKNNLSEYYNNLGVINSIKSKLFGEKYNSENYFLKSLLLNKHGISKLNLSLIYILNNKLEDSEILLKELLEQISNKNLVFNGLILYFYYSDPVKLNIENIYIKYKNKDDIYINKLEILKDKIFELLGDIYFKRKLNFISLEFYLKVEAKSHEVFYKISIIEYLNKNYLKSKKYIQKSLFLNPFNSKAQMLKIKLEKTIN